MQPFVHAVFQVVVTVIATLLIAGLSGIITLLLMDGQPPSLRTEHEPDTDGHGALDVPPRRGSSAQPGLSTPMRAS